MSDIHIRREHTLGLAGARDVAQRWIAEADKKFDMTCALQPGEDRDVVTFTRSGVKGELVVTADAFELNAKLGILLGAFKKDIEREVERVLDKLLHSARDLKTIRRR